VSHEVLRRQKVALRPLHPPPGPHGDFPPT
jgi:hypothetical protein